MMAMWIAHAEGKLVESSLGVTRPAVGVAPLMASASSVVFTGATLHPFLASGEDAEPQGRGRHRTTKQPQS